MFLFIKYVLFRILRITIFIFNNLYISYNYTYSLKLCVFDCANKIKKKPH